MEASLQPQSSGRRPPCNLDAERAILGLRLCEGIEAASADDPVLSVGLAWAHAEGLVATSEGRTSLTRRGRLLANEVFARLLPDGAASGADSGAGA